MRLLRAALLTAFVLTVAGAAQAGLTEDVDETADQATTAFGETLGEVETSHQTGTGGGGPTLAPPSGDDVDRATKQVERTADQAEQRAQDVARELEDLLDLQGLQAMAEKELHGAQTAVGDAQRDIEKMLGEDEPSGSEPEPAEPTMTTASQNADMWDTLEAPMLLLAGTAATFGLIGWLLGQSATVGAGAAGTAAARGGRRFLPYASPLFTRFEKDTVLGHPKREAIYGEIVEKPGVTLQDLCGTTGLSRTAVTHHLRLMEQQHLVVSKRVGRSRHFFENGGRFGRDQKDAYAVLHNDRSKDIHGFIRKNPGSIQKDLCAAFGIQASVAHWHVKRLVEANLVEAIRQGRTVSYFPSTDVSGYA